MAYYQNEKFYMNDEKKYLIENNKEFLQWLKISIEGGYKCPFKISVMQELINSITNWYEMKYPEMRLGALKNSLHYKKFENIENISDKMTVQHFLYWLPISQYDIMDCNFYSTSYIEPKERYLIKKYMCFTCIGFKHSLYYYIDETGKVIETRNIKKYMKKEDMNADELLIELEKSISDEYDLTNLRSDINNYYCDIELRHRLLQLSALSILYSKNTNPERGYERAKLFINEFKSELGLLLSTDEIDEIMDKAKKYPEINPKYKVKIRK